MIYAYAALILVGWSLVGVVYFVWALSRRDMNHDDHWWEWVIALPVLLAANIIVWLMEKTKQ